MKQQMKNLLNVEQSILEELFQKVSVSDYIFVDKSLLYHGKGYCSERVIFQHKEKHYSFLVVEYLNDYYTYTVPYEVIPIEEVSRYVTYTSWV